MSIQPDRPNILRPDDPGADGVHFMKDAPKQDDAFCKAMRRAMVAGKERVREGVRTASPDDCRPVRRSYPVSFVPTASVLTNA